MNKLFVLSLFVLVSVSEAVLMVSTNEITGRVYAIETDGVNWNYANIAAGNLSVSGLSDFYLAVIDDAAENAYLFGLLNSVGVSTTALDGGGATYAWIGFSQSGGPEPAGGWSWVSGSSSYLNWGSNAFGSEPDNFFGVQNHGALALTDWPMGYAGEWNDLDGSSNSLAYVMESSTVVPEPSTFLLTSSALLLGGLMRDRFRKTEADSLF